jgi:signal peptidase I
MLPLIRLVFVLKLAIVSCRSFVFAPFYIPSESMLPRLLNGYLLPAKWPYGYSRKSLPSLPLIPGRIWPASPNAAMW